MKMSTRGLLHVLALITVSFGCIFMIVHVHMKNRELWIQYSLETYVYEVQFKDLLRTYDFYSRVDGSELLKLDFSSRDLSTLVRYFEKFEKLPQATYDVNFYNDTSRIIYEMRSIIDSHKFERYFKYDDEPEDLEDPFIWWCFLMLSGFLLGCKFFLIV